MLERGGWEEGKRAPVCGRKCIEYSQQTGTIWLCERSVLEEREKAPSAGPLTPCIDSSRLPSQLESSFPRHRDSEGNFPKGRPLLIRGRLQQRALVRQPALQMTRRGCFYQLCF